MPKVTQLLSGCTGTRIKAVWLWSLSTKLPLCVFRQRLDPHAWHPPSNPESLGSKGSWTLVPGTQPGPDKCSPGAASLLGSGSEHQFMAHMGPCPVLSSLGLTWAWKLFSALWLGRLWKK